MFRGLQQWTASSGFRLLQRFPAPSTTTIRVPQGAIHRGGELSYKRNSRRRGAYVPKIRKMLNAPAWPGMPPRSASGPYPAPPPRTPRSSSRRAAVQLVPDAGLVQQDGDHLGLPGPRRARGDDDQVRVARGDLVEVARMAGVEAHAAAAGLAGAQTGRPDHDQHRRARLDAAPVERLVAGIVGGDVES